MKAFLFFFKLCGLFWVWFSFTLSTQHAFGHCPCPPHSVVNFSVHICCTGEDFGYPDWTPSACRRGRVGRAPDSFSWWRAGGGDAPTEAADPLPCLVYESCLHNATALYSATACLTTSAKPASLQSQQIAPGNGHLQPCTDLVPPIPTSRAILWVFLLLHSFQRERSPSKEACYFGTVLFCVKVDHILSLILVDKKVQRDSPCVWQRWRKGVRQILGLQIRTSHWKSPSCSEKIHFWGQKSMKLQSRKSECAKHEQQVIYRP